MRIRQVLIPPRCAHRQQGTRPREEKRAGEEDKRILPSQVVVHLAKEDRCKRVAEQVKDQAVRLVAERTGAQAEASTRQANAAAGLPALREAEARAAAALQRLMIARETLEQEETRAKSRVAELDQRLIQLTGDAEREQRLAIDAESALSRLAIEEASLQAEMQASLAKRAGANARVAAADTMLTQAEQSFGTLTGALAELTARRSQLEAALRQHG